LGFLDRFKKSKAPAEGSPASGEQAILIYVQGEDLEGSIPIQDKLYVLLEDSSLGMFDGNEVGGGELVLFLYGPDAELLFKHIEPTLKEDGFCNGAKAIIRFGGPGAPQREVTL